MCVTLTRRTVTGRMLFKQVLNHKHVNGEFHISCGHFTFPSLALHSGSTGAFPFMTTVLTTSVQHQRQTIDKTNLSTAKMKYWVHHVLSNQFKLKKQKPLDDDSIVTALCESPVTPKPVKIQFQCLMALHSNI